uniref:Uncharacterized protein n=1 Tax=Pseudo-nitzschia australis TaxID=44445 RepID=A0A6V0AQD2_9STRA
MQNEEEAEMEHITSQDEMDPPGKQMIESHLSIPSPTKETLRIVGEVDDGNDGDGDETDYNENDEHENGETDQHSLPIEQTMSQESLLDETVVDTEQEVNDDQDDNDRHRHQHQQQQQHQGQVGGEEKVQGDTGAIARVMAMQGSGVVASEDDNATRAKLVGLGAVGTVSAATTTMMTNHPASATTKLEPQEENYAAATAAADEQYDDSLDMDTYLSETMSQVGGAGSSSGGNNNGIGNNNHNNSRSFDGVSVVSGRSHRTTGTNYTTQSTRSRRPGQAKVRLERERDNTNTSGMAMSIGSTHTSKSHYGWQDSIEAAALKAGKVWDPVYGWRDYVDPNRIEIPTDDFFDESMALASAQQQKQEMQAQAHGKTHANTNANVMGVAAAATAGPSMAEWGGNQQQNQQHSPSRSVGKSNPRSPARSGTPGRQRRAHKVMPTSARDDKPRGWAETMKAATAKLNMEGKQWDPVTGWDGLGEDEIPGGRDTADDVDVAITADSDLQDFGTVEQLDAIANKQDKSLQFLSEDEDQPSNNNEVDGNGNANTNYGADAEEEEATVDGDQSSATKSTSKNSGRYIQIAETGSIQSHYRRTRPNQSSRRTVNVKKENLNQGEVDLFQESAERRKGNGPVDLDSLYEKEDFPTAFPQSEQQDEVISSPNANAIYQKIYESQSNESFDSATDFSWDADEAANDTIDSYGRKPAPRLKINIRDSTSVSSRPNSAKSGKALSEASFESGTSSIPKLAAPRRDTSPIRPSKTKTKTNGAPLSEMLATATTSSHSARYNDNPFKDNDLYKETLRPGDVGSDYDENENENEIININDNCTEAVTRVVQKNQPNASYDAGSNAPPNMSELHKLWEAKTTSWDKGDDRRRESGSPKNDSPAAAAAAAPTNTQNSEWKSFLQKKVQAESAAATAEAARDNDDDDERDTIFNFDGGRSEENFKKSSSGGKPQRRESKPLLGEPDDRSAFDDISEISPIRHQNDDSESDYGQNSEASTTVLQGTTFLQRLQACAAPVMKGGPNCASDGPISAHLAFLRNNPSVAGSSPDKNASAKSATASPSSINNLMNEGKVGILQVSAGICGRPDIIVEDNEDESTIDESVPSRSPMQSPPPPYMNKIKSRDSNSSNNTSRSRSNSRSRQNANKDDLSSVISDGFGQKSAYLEAIAMKAAVAGKSKKKKRRSQESEVSATTAASTSRRSSSGSIFSSSGNSNSKRSDKFQQFLDRRASKDEHLPSPSPLQPQLPPTAAADKYEVSTRAEKYASEKVNEMMDAMARRTGTDKDDPYNRAARAQEEYEKTGAFPTLPGATKSGKDTTMLAAEELAAARVEAMMQRLSVQNLEFNEVEI